MEELNKTQEVKEQPQTTVTNVPETANVTLQGAENQGEEKPEAGCLGIGAAVLFPLIGIIIYFVQRKEVKNPSAYLYGALGGFVGGLILQFISAAIAETL